MSLDDGSHDVFLDEIAALGAPLVALLDGLERLARRLHPPALPELRGALAPLVDRLETAQTRFETIAVPDGVEPMAEALASSSRLAIHAGRLFCDAGSPTEEISRVLGSMRLHAEAQARLFALADVLPPVHRFFLEPALHARHPLPFDAPVSERPVGLFQAADGSDQRGGFSLFVPSLCEGDGPWPLVVALHGGSGHGAEFLWTWLREARSRGCLLLAPTSIRSTWSLGQPDDDAARLASQVAFVADTWPVDPERILLTGLSDGATYTLLNGLGPDVPWTALAPVSGVFHPLNFSNGNLERAAGRRIRLVHGALDWMFPVQTAREAAALLERAGADLCYREVADLSHAYPREENARILEWFDPGLALPDSDGA